MNQPRQLMNPEQTQAIKNLIVEVIKQAKRDASSRSRPKRYEARRWLEEEAQLWIDAIVDIHPDKVQAWVHSRGPVSSASARCKRKRRLQAI